MEEPRDSHGAVFDSWNGRLCRSISADAVLLLTHLFLSARLSDIYGIQTRHPNVE